MAVAPSALEKPSEPPIFRKRLGTIALIVGVVAIFQIPFLQKLCAERSFLREAVARWTDANRKRARQAFEAGAFKDAIALLEPAIVKQGDDLTQQLLYARALECSERFEDAGRAYAKIAVDANAPPFVYEALKFCERMARHRGSTRQTPREIDYRLFDELMRRDQPEMARFIARRLSPDQAPLLASVGALIADADPRATIEPTPQGDRVDVTLTKASSAIFEWLHDLRINTLSLVDVGLSDARLLEGIDLRGLDLRRNPLGDFSEVSFPRLERLDLSDTPVADVRAVSSMPLKELNLAHTNVSSLVAVTLCPLEKLDLAGLPIHDLSPLRGISLRSLNISHTDAEDLTPLISLPLEELVLDNTRTRDLAPLRGMKLKKLSITHTAVADLSPLVGLPIAELDLWGCPNVRDLDPLTKCLRLERLRLPDHMKVTASVLQLPRLKFIEFEHFHGQLRTASAAPLQTYVMR